MTKLTVGVIFGGVSPEHDVSILSAKEVVAAIDQSQFNIKPIYITQQGQWLTGEFERLINNPEACDVINLLPIPNQAIDLDLVFPVLHGRYGEDGCIQGLLEMAQIPYVGSDVIGSALCMNKVLTKQILKQNNLPTPNFINVNKTNFLKQPDIIIQQVSDQLGFPCFVKPVNAGSSVGITKVKASEQLATAIQLAFEYDQAVIIEQSIEDVREIESAVIGNDEPKVADCCGEIHHNGEFYDYQAKYHDDKLRLEVPAQLTQEQLATIQQYAAQAFTLLHCRGFARVDFLLRKSDGAIFISEINTIPGFTQVSLFPQVWQGSGLRYTELLSQLFKLALERDKK